MKRFTIILFAALFIAANTSAQDKPGKGSFSTEVQFNPFDQNGKTFQLDGLKFRYFLTDKDAIRLKLGFNLNHSNSKNEEPHDNDSYYDITQFKYTSGDFHMNVGYERHFDVSKRISLYAGGSLGFIRHFASTKISELESHYSDGFKGEITNGAITQLSGSSSIDVENLLPLVNDRAFWGFNAAVFTGIDFYVYKGLYVGTELGLKLETQKSSKMEYSGRYNGERYDEESTDNLKAVNFKTYIEPVLRLGWTF